MPILNFGSMNIDHIYRVDHITAPGETIASQALQYSPGGKGLNQSISLAKSGAEVYHAGYAGKDGSMLVDLLEQSGVRTDYLKTVDTVNGHAIIQVNREGQNSIIIHSGSNGALTQAMVDETLDLFRDDVLVLIQNETSQVEYIARQCAARHLTLAFNPSPYSPELESFPFDAVSYLLINETEGFQISGEEEPDRIVDYLLARYPHMHVVLTLGSKGVLYAEESRRIHQDAFRVNAVDTTGAGDTFTGFFLGLTVQGFPAEDALRFACAAAALSVTQIGAAASVPTMAQVEEFLLTGK